MDAGVESFSFYTPVGVTSFRTDRARDLQCAPSEPFLYASRRDVIQDMHLCNDPNPGGCFYTPVGVTSFRTPGQWHIQLPYAFLYASRRDVIQDVRKSRGSWRARRFLYASRRD